MTKQRTWNISWFVDCSKTKEVLETVDCDQYVDRATERHAVLDKIKTKHNLHEDKFIFISAVIRKVSRYIIRSH